MGIPVVSSNSIQALVLPWCTYMGQEAYDNDSLTPTDKYPKISDVNASLTTGNSSNNLSLPKTYLYQSKFDKDFVVDFRNKVVFKKLYHEKINMSDSYGFQGVFYEDEFNIYFLATYTSLCRCLILNKNNLNIKESFVAELKYSSSSYDIESCAFFYEKNSNILKVFLRGNFIRYFVQYNLNKRSASILNADTSDYADTYKMISCNYQDYFYYLRYYTGSSTSFRGCFLLKNTQSFSFPSSQVDSSFKIIAHTENLLSLLRKNKGILVIKLNEETNTCDVLQEIFSGSHYVEIDENNILVGDGLNIKRLSFNAPEEKWEEVSSFKVSQYDYFTLDINGRIWVKCEDEILRILPGQGVNLSCSFEKDCYHYLGNQIKTYISVSALDSFGNSTFATQKIQLIGPAVFDNETDTYIVTFDKENKINIPITITGAGDIDCILVF